ncbi:PEGA domain-containing protein [Luteibaculum oceani]|uniref:PEGA domain-containing protein n=1 Tax=Luteibaculum oceani TaxID=1294296 RepID=A0A5C6V043_9FLAO|nr:PEGA domain-containing protein [Luteibaculum oceani]TXC78529.1 PEGA domain-containing protein [Luteibaculum oceani]
MVPKLLKYALIFWCCVSTYAYGQSSPGIFIQTSPEGAKIESKGNYVGDTPLLVKYDDLRKGKIVISKEGYDEVRIPKVTSNSISFRLKPKSGYNRNPVKSRFIAVFETDTLYIDPFELTDASRSFNCFDVNMNYQVLGAYTTISANKIYGCGLKYIARYNMADPVFANYLNREEMPFAVQQIQVDVRDIARSFQKKSKKPVGLGRYDFQQMWYVLAENGNKKLLLLPTESPMEESRKFQPEFSGNIPPALYYGNLLFMEDSSLTLIKNDNFPALIPEFSNNSTLMNSAGQLETLEAFFMALEEDEYLIGEIFTETWGNKATKSGRDENKIEAILAERNIQRLSIGGEQDLQIDTAEAAYFFQINPERPASSTVIKGEKATTVQLDKPWYLRFDSSATTYPTKTIAKEDQLYFIPEEGILRKEQSKETWYLKNVDNEGPDMLDHSKQKFENKIIRQPKNYGNDKEWYLRSPN